MTARNTYREFFPSILTVYSGVGFAIAAVWLLCCGKLGMCLSGLYMIAMGCFVFKINELLVKRHLDNRDTWAMQVEPYTEIFGLQLWNWFLVFLWSRIILSAFASNAMEANPIPVLLASYAAATAPLSFVMIPGILDKQKESVYARHIVAFAHCAYALTLLLVVLGLNGRFGLKTVFFFAGVFYMGKSFQPTKRK